MRRMSDAIRLVFGQALVALVFVFALPLCDGPAAALSLKIGVLEIQDNMTGDRNSANGIIEFDNSSGTASDPDDFQCGRSGEEFSTCQGRVVVNTFQNGGGTITLTDLDVRRTGQDLFSPLKFIFSHSFSGPPSPTRAFDKIDGQFRNTTTNGLGSNSEITFQGFVNNFGIGSSFNKQVGAQAGQATVNFSQPQHNRNATGGPFWALKGELDVFLDQSDNLRLPDSAIVGIPEPGTAVLVLFGFTFLSLVRRNRN